MLGPKYETILLYAHVPGSTAFRASRSASIIGRLYGDDDNIWEHVDLPVAIEPVNPINLIVLGL